MSTDNQQFKHTAVIKYDFQTEEYARIAYETMSADPDLRPKESSKEFQVEKNYLICKFTGKTPKYLKKTITTTIVYIDLLYEMIENLKVENFE